MKSLPEKNNTKTCSTHNERKFVIAERFIRTLKIKFMNTWPQYQKMCILIN